jgi:hypothetical protein
MQRIEAVVGSGPSKLPSSSITGRASSVLGEVEVTVNLMTCGYFQRHQRVDGEEGTSTCAADK